MKNLSCFSDSTTEDQFQRPQYLELSIYEASNLCAISEYSEFLQPYIRISQDEKEWETSVSFSNDSKYSWDEQFELYIDLSHSFALWILDKDDFGSDTLLGGFTVRPELFQMQFQNMIRLNLSILPTFDPEEVIFPSAEDQITSENSDAVLSIGIRLVDLDAAATYSVSIKNHKNIVGKSEFFTLYEVSLLRNDGANWKVSLRFSQIEAFRRALIKQNPLLKCIQFPSKTYFNWICCRKFSKFNEDTINKRKVALELFFNSLLSDPINSRNIDLRSLLKIP